MCYPYRSKDENIIKTKFVYYYLKSKQNNIMGTLVTRGSIPAINKYDIDRILLPVPPLKIQNEIIHILDDFTERLVELSAELSAELKSRKEQYEYYRDKLLSSDEVSESFDTTHTRTRIL